MHTHIHAQCVYTYTNLYLYINSWDQGTRLYIKRVDMCTYKFVCASVHMYIYTHTYTCLYVCMHVSNAYAALHMYVFMLSPLKLSQTRSAGTQVFMSSMYACVYACVHICIKFGKGSLFMAA